MKHLKTKHYEEATVLLEAGVDYAPSDLEFQWGSPNLRQLPPGKLMEIAKKNGYDTWSWTGYEGMKAPGTLEVNLSRAVQTEETKGPEEPETVYTSEIFEQITETILLAPSATADLMDILSGLDSKTVEDDLADLED